MKSQEPTSNINSPDNVVSMNIYVDTVRYFENKRVNETKETEKGSCSEQED